MPDVNRVQLWGFVNAYLVEEEDGFTVVDTMLPRGAKKILAAARRTGKPIARIALTHGHGDHIGDTVSIAKRTGAPVVAIVELAGEIGEEGVRTFDPNL